MIPLGWYWACDDWCLDLTLSIEAKQYNLDFIRQESLLPNTPTVLQMLLRKLQVSYHVCFTEERPLSGISAIESRSVECFSDACPRSFSHLPKGTLELSQADLWVLGHFSYHGPSLLIAQFGLVVLWRVLVVLNFFH